MRRLPRQPAVRLLGLQWTPGSLQHKRWASNTADSCANVEKYLKEYEFMPSEKSAACLRVLGNTTQPAVIDVITTALSNPTIFDFVPVFELRTSSSMLSLTAHGHPLFAHLWVFLSSGLEDAHAYPSLFDAQPLKDSAKINKPNRGLDAAQLERNVRLLVLATRRFQRTVRAGSRCAATQVERLVMMAIRAGLLADKLVQTVGCCAPPHVYSVRLSR
ncbi:hypothetical protein H4582DRAFT_2080907 [Lactarius indigo]|nr:hypothetical protein H4582DRAFT_2080907 [Lactarius indigo]